MPQAAALHQEKLPWGAEPPAGAPHLQESWASAAWAHGTAVAAQHKGLRLGAGAQAAATACPGGRGCRHDPSKGPHKTAAGLPPRNRLHSAGPRHLPGQLQVRTASACVPGPPVRHSCPRWAPHPGAGPASMPAPSSRQDGQAARSALRPHHSPPLRYLPRSPPLAQPRPRLPTRGPASAYL